MKWTVGYERPPLRSIKPVEYESADDALHDMSMRLKSGCIVRSVYQQAWYEGDQKTPDQLQATHVPYEFEKGDHR